MLLVAFGEAGVEDFAAVGLAVAVGVLGVEDIRGAGDEYAVTPGHHAGGERQVVEEDGRFVVLAVALGGLQALDPAAGLAFAVHAERIVAHLDDPELAIRSPGEGDGVFDKRLRGDQLDGETRPHLDRAKRRLRRLRLRLDTFKQLVERPAVDVVLEQGGVLVLPPQVPRVDPEAVVRPVARDHRQGVRIAALAGHHLAAPTGLHVFEEVDAVFFLVGEDDVIEAVLVDVNKAYSVVYVLIL